MIYIGFQATLLYGQDYIVTSNGDTLFGEVKPAFANKPYAVKLNKIIYLSNSISEYKYHHKSYRSVYLSALTVGENDTVFLELIKDGNVKLYFGKYRWVGCGCGNEPDGRTTATHYFISNKDLPVMPIKSNALGRVTNYDLIKKYYEKLLGLPQDKRLSKKQLIKKVMLFD